MKDLLIYCYVRPWNFKQFSLLANEIWPENANIVFVSEHQGVDHSQLNHRYYQNLKATSLDTANIDVILSEERKAEIVLRCRLLRVMSDSEARKHLNAMAVAIHSGFKEGVPDYFLSLTVDSYVLDLYDNFCDYFSVKKIFLVPTFVNGHFRVTSKGEGTINSQSSQELADELRTTLLNPLYVPSFNTKSTKSPVKYILKRWLSNLLRVPYFFIKRYLSHDKFNYHYWSSQVVSQLNFNYLPKLSFGDPAWEECLKERQKPSIYIPLQMVPECTVDYWVNDVAYADYYNVIDKFIDTYSADFNIIIKEHPSILGSRPIGFYKNMELRKDVTIVPTYTPSNYVIEKADSILVLTGTVGFEAALRGKAVFSFAEPYYKYGRFIHTISLDTPAEYLNEQIRKANESPVTSAEQDELLEHLCTQLYKGRFLNDGTWDENNPEHRHDTLTMAQSLKASFGQK